MDVLLVVAGVVIVAIIFAIVGSVMYRADISGARGILSAWGWEKVIPKDDNR